MDRVLPLARITAAQAVAGEADEAGVAATRGRPVDAAVRAYREMLHNDLERGPLYHAAQVMHAPVITVAADDEVAHAWRVLRDRRIHQAPVLDDAGNLIGIVSERDLLTAINIDAERIVESLGRRVSDVMTTPVVAAAPVTDIRRIATAMLERGVDGVPIVNDVERLVGFVSRSDILRAVVTDPPLSLWR
ncbi:MAG: CBS domain-containing protein [Rhodocyclaceae bacterium]|nr:CBS domain-containing protein [Rhodocyclaceae bacterium]